MRARICSFVSVKVRLTFARDTSRRRAHFIFIGGNRISERHYQWCVFLLITRVIESSPTFALISSRRGPRGKARPLVLSGGRLDVRSRPSERPHVHLPTG